MRIGILGGTFDPVHLGHAALAKSALKEFKLDRLYFVPAKFSPFKRSARRAPPSEPIHRLKMLRLAAKKIARSRVSTLELNRLGPSYTFQTIAQFHKRFPKSDLFFVMGSDAFSAFKHWKNWEKILDVCALVVADRKGFKEELGRKFSEKKEFVEKLFSSKVTRLEASLTRSKRNKKRVFCSSKPLLKTIFRQTQIMRLKSEMPKVSSTEIRNGIRKGQHRLRGSIQSVSRYIKKHQLYA